MSQLLKPVRLEPVLHNKRSHCSEKPAHCNEEQPLLAATREILCTAKKTQCSQKKKKKCPVHVARHVTSDGCVNIFEGEMEELTKGIKKHRLTKGYRT